MIELPEEYRHISIIEGHQQRRLNSYESAFEQYLQATIKNRREAFEERRIAQRYAAVSAACALISMLALVWTVL